MTQFLNNAEHAKAALGAKGKDEGLSPLLMVQGRIIERLERAGVFELAVGVNVRQNAIKHLKKRG